MMEIEPLRPYSDDLATESDSGTMPCNASGDALSANGQSCRTSAIVIANAITQMSPPRLADLSELASPIIATNPTKKSHGSFELKFLIDESRAEEIVAWARQHLDPDPHFDPEFGDGYRVNSLYLDTPQFDVFHRMDGFRQQKFRLRRYGRESLVWFEEKRKRKGLVRKRRVSVMESDVSTRLVLPAEADWEGGWFRKKVDEQGLRPVCQVTYQRFARVKATDEGPIRLTIDDSLTARLADGWTVPAGSLEGVSLLDERRILELKFRGAMPVLFRRLIEQQRLQLTPFSKYRTSVEECVPLDTLVGGETGVGGETRKPDNA